MMPVVACSDEGDFKEEGVVQRTRWTSQQEQAQLQDGQCRYTCSTCDPRSGCRCDEIPEALT